MLYSVTHATTFSYSAPVRSSMTEVRKQPRTEDAQRCRSFSLRLQPQAKVFHFRDSFGNVVHHFDIPGEHTRLEVVAEATVELNPSAPLPDAVEMAAWDQIDALQGSPTFWDFLMPSTFARPGTALRDLARELDVRRREDPLTLLRELNMALYRALEYAPNSTRVDSPIEEALCHRRGVCQDYAHIFITLAREVGIPCRYVSGYLFHRTDEADRSLPDATHAWVEAYVPNAGWVGFDPTNNLVAAGRHIRTAVGRDYADVPPTRGIFRGLATSELSVSVQVRPTPERTSASDAPPSPAVVPIALTDQ